jgi:hypothetical protein
MKSTMMRKPTNSLGLEIVVWASLDHSADITLNPPSSWQAATEFPTSGTLLGRQKLARNQLGIACCTLPHY